MDEMKIVSKFTRGIISKELLIRLNNNRDIPPLITLENFEELMDEYACKNISNSFLFSCAKDMTRWIIDLLIA